MAIPLSISTLFYREADLTLAVDPHRHPVHQWYCCLHGSLTVAIHGHPPLILGSEESVLIQPGILRAVTCDTRAPGYLVAIFDLPGVDFEPVVHRRLKLPGELRDDLRALVGFLREPATDETRLLREALVVRLVLGLARANRTAPPPTLSPLNAADHQGVVAQAEAFMHQHAHKALRRAQIAAAVNLSEPHFARVFRAATGTSVLDRLTDIRMTRAKTLLLESPLAVTAIGKAVGFSSFSHFAATFRTRIGVTPSDYRRSGGVAYRT
jgi:AraC-like DNA-binding protein